MSAMPATEQSVARNVIIAKTRGSVMSERFAELLARIFCCSGFEIDSIESFIHSSLLATFRAALL
jgi:hypothetical protein